MPPKTTNMGLNVPGTSDLASIDDLNYNTGEVDTHRHSGIVDQYGYTDGLPVKAVQHGASAPTTPTTPGQLYVHTAAPALYFAPNTGAWIPLQNAGAARENLAVNGGFEIWQRGTGAFLTNGAWGPDRWLLAMAGTDTLSVSRNTANADVGSTAAAACTFGLVNGGGSTQLAQILRYTDYPQLVGRTVSLCARVKCSTPGAVRLGLYDGATWRYSPFHTGSGSYETLMIPAVILVATNGLAQVSLFFHLSCTAYINNVMLALGPAAADYVPLPPGEDLLRCERYYEVHGQDGRVHTFYPRIDDAASGAHIISRVHPFVTRKAVLPTVTKVGALWLAGNCDQPVVAQPKLGSYLFRVTAVAAGYVGCYPASNTDVVTAEANP